MTFITASAIRSPKPSSSGQRLVNCHPWKLGFRYDHYEGKASVIGQLRGKSGWLRSSAFR